LISGNIYNSAVG